MSDNKDKKSWEDKTSSSTLKWVDYRKKPEEKEKKKSYLDYDYYDYDDIYDEGSWYDWYGTKRKKSYSSSLGSTSTYGSGSTSSWWKSSSSYTKRESMSSLIGSYSRLYSPGLSKDTKDKLTSIVNSAIKLTKEFISILDLPFKITLNFINSESDDDCSYHGLNSRNLFIPTKVVDFLGSSKMTDDKIINTVVGMGIHEAAHLMYTCMADIETVKDPITEFFLNLIEDWRVEDCLLRDRPGYQDFIDTAMEFRVSLAKEAECPSFYKILGDKVVRSLLFNTIDLIRFPQQIDKEFVKEEEFKAYFSKIRNLIDKSTLNSTLDSVNLAKDIKKELTQVLYDYSKKVYTPTPIIDTVNTLVTDKQFQYKYYIPTLYGKDKVSDTYKRDIGYAIKNCVSGKISDTSFYNDLGVCLGEVEKGIKPDTFIIKNIVGNKKLYLNLAKNLSRFVPMIKKKVMNVEKNTTIDIYGCRQGLLDTSKIAEAIQDIPQVYYRRGQVKTNKVSIGVLVDESGSMWGDREEAARDAAILLNEAFGNIPGIDLFIYGHSADEKESHSTDIRVYREPGFNNHYALSEIQARCENRDGDAILETATRIRKFTENQCILFVISDGQPSASGYRGDAAIKDTKEKVKVVEKMGFEVIQITICNLHSSVRQMFSKSISLEKNLDDFPKELGKILRKTILDNKVTTITW